MKKGSSGKFSAANDRKAYVEIGNKHFTVKRQAELLRISRSGVYRKQIVRTVSMKSYTSDARSMSTLYNLHLAINAELNMIQGQLTHWRL